MSDVSKSRQCVRFALVIVLFILFAKLIENDVLISKFDERHARQIQNIFAEKEKSLLEGIDALESLLADNASVVSDPLLAFYNVYAENLRQRGLYLFIYRNDSLIFWTSNDVPVSDKYSTFDFNRPYLSLGNNSYFSGKYASFVKSGDIYNIVGLALIKYVYNIENKYLKTSFQKEFDLPPNVKISPIKQDDAYEITDKDGQFMWSLIFDSTCFEKKQIYIPAFVYLFAIFLFFGLFDRILRINFKKGESQNVYLIVLAFVLAVIRLVMQHWQIPGVFYQIELFTPIYYGSRWFPSLGELGLWCVFIGFYVIELYRFLEFHRAYRNKLKYYVYISIACIVLIAWFFVLCFILKELVINSSGIFETESKLTSLFNIIGLFGYAIFLILLVSFCLLLDKTVQLIRMNQTFKYKYWNYILTVIVLALFSFIFINHYSNEKNNSKKKLLVTNLSSRNDLTTEYLLWGISDRIISDNAALAEYVHRGFRNADFSEVLKYIKQQYFYSSYWNRYKFQCYVCDNDWQLDITNAQIENCVNYFKHQTITMGAKLPRSEFYYIDRPNDVSWYLGWFRIAKEDTLPLHLFIELWPSEVWDEIGYPELLLDDRLVADNILKGYSYSKYLNNERIMQSGDYRYNLKGDMFQTDNSDYHTVYADGMEHLVYRPDKNNMIVLSSESSKTTNYIFNFSYIFIFYLIIATIFLLIIHLPALKKEFLWNIRNKIQILMIIVLLVSFAIITVFTVLYITGNYLNKHNDIVTDKMRAIHANLAEEIIRYDRLEEKNDNDNYLLAGWLKYFQRLFSTDINLFDARGQLIATSLPDIFDKGLVGRQINPEAYFKLSFGQKQPSIIEQEDIGGLHYISAYELITDHDNKVIAYLNLPYFTHHDALSEEISNVIVVLFIFYMAIIIITVIISVMVSNQITKPLMMLQDKFRNIKLGEKNELVIYNSRDELGGFVKEYNKAIEALSQSAESLARSERETAWREMAKQIAHEINNPLTPMKLSIQHLKRAYDNKSERFDQYMENISRSLVEQIDTLSTIATEFSNLAKMPVANNERINLLEQINNVVAIFAVDNYKRAFHINDNGIESVIIYADKEHISRVFVNLFKNAVQAIPINREPKIIIDVVKLHKIVWVRVKDNGTGIPEDMLEKVFRPYFSSKSSGMGIGLSIVRNIIENIGGTINCRTEQNVGTKFFISIPTDDD